MHNIDGVTPQDQYRALGLSTLAFTVCFAVWTIFSIIGVKIKQDLGLSETQFGLLVATPVLTGSISSAMVPSGTPIGEKPASAFSIAICKPSARAGSSFNSGTVVRSTF